jgi:hypothetical protein
MMTDAVDDGNDWQNLKLKEMFTSSPAYLLLAEF